MQAIVTGGAGFIGSNLAWELLNQHAGAWLTVIDDFSSADFRNLTGFPGDVVAVPCEEVDWEARFAGQSIDCIYHLASITDTTFHQQREMLARNVEGFRRALAFAERHGIRLVYASSAATYGQANGIMREDQPPAPANVYGFSKMVLDNLARAAAQRGVSVAGVRYFNVYGPREAHKGKMASMVYQLYLQLKAGQAPRVFRNGDQKRDFVYVKDAVAGTLAAGASKATGVFNIGSGVAADFNEIIALLNSALNTSKPTEYIENPYQAFYQNHTEADLSQSRAAIGYSPVWLPKQGVADYVAWLETGAAGA
jgi:ADP-L-glycero-D-manno-heptose 6-epimerase